MQISERIEGAHRQDLDDVLAAARLCFSERKTDVTVNMFRASFGALFCDGGSKFGDRLHAHEQHKHQVPEVLSAIAMELDARESATNPA